MFLKPCAHTPGLHSGPCKQHRAREQHPGAKQSKFLPSTGFPPCWLPTIRHRTPWHRKPEQKTWGTRTGRYVHAQPFPSAGDSGSQRSLPKDCRRDERRGALRQGNLLGGLTSVKLIFLKNPHKNHEEKPHMTKGAEVWRGGWPGRGMSPDRCSRAVPGAAQGSGSILQLAAMAATFSQTQRAPSAPEIIAAVEGQKTILSLCQALGKLPPTHPVRRFVSGLGIPGTSARLPRPTAHLRVRTCSASRAPAPPAHCSPHGAHPRLGQAPPAPAPLALPARWGWKKQRALPSILPTSPGAEMFCPQPVPLSK